MSRETCWYCGKRQANETGTYPKPYVKATFRGNPTSPNVSPITLQVPRCIECARVHLRTEGGKEFNKLWMPVLVAFVIMGLGYLVGWFAFENGANFVVPLVAVFALAFIFRKVHNNRIRSNFGTKKLHTKLDDYLQLLAADQRSRYYLNPYTDLDDMLTLAQRQSLIGLKKVKTVQSKIDSYIGGIEKAQTILQTATPNTWTYEKYLSARNALPKTLQPQIPDVPKARWDSMLKRDQFEVRNLFLEKIERHIVAMQREMNQ